jgi:hypothetical protein
MYSTYIYIRSIKVSLKLCLNYLLSHGKCGKLHVNDAEKRKKLQQLSGEFVEGYNARQLKCGYVCKECMYFEDGNFAFVFTIKMDVVES